MATMDANLELQVAPAGSAEADLWLAVLEEALRSDPPARVREWLRSKDGRLVAWLAGVDPDWVSDRVIPAVHRLQLMRRGIGRGSGKARGRPARSHGAFTRH